MMAIIEMRYERRRAQFIAKQFHEVKFGYKKGDVVKVDVLGLFQCSDEDGAQPYFICELENGRCIYVLPEDIQFIQEVNDAKDSN